MGFSLVFADQCEANVFTTPKGLETPASTEQKGAEATERRMKKKFALREDLDVFGKPIRPYDYFMNSDVVTVNKAWVQGCIHSSGYLVISNEYICLLVLYLSFSRAEVSSR